MSDAVFQRSVPIGRSAPAKSAARWPRGFGLLIAAAISIGLWIGIFWIVARALG